MPGGFTSSNRDGYQTVDEEAFTRQARPPGPPNPVPPHAAAPAAPGAYQTL